MTFRFLRPTLASLFTFTALALSGCPASSDPPGGTDAGPVRGDASFDAPPLADTGAADIDGGPSVVDGGPSTVDGAPSTVDGGPSAVDGGPSAVDGGPSAVDGGPAATDAGSVGTDAGSSTMGCSPACSAAQYCDLCSISQSCVTRPADMGRICPAIYMPVCGCDGRTYSNGCALASAGIPQLHDGECVVDPAPGTCARDRDCGSGEYCALCRGPGGGVMVCLPVGAVC